MFIQKVVPNLQNVLIAPLIKVQLHMYLPSKLYDPNYVILEVGFKAVN